MYTIAAYGAVGVFT